MREDALIRPLDTWLVQELNPTQRPQTIAKLVEQARIGIPVPTTPEPLGPTVAKCDAKLAHYRAALHAGADPAVVAGWIAETQAERKQALREQAEQTPPTQPREINQPTAEQITAVIDELGDLITAIRDAEPEHKLEVYRSLGLHLSYHPETRTVRAQIDLEPHRWQSIGLCPRGNTNRYPTGVSAGRHDPAARLTARQRERR